MYGSIFSLFVLFINFLTLPGTNGASSTVYVPAATVYNDYYICDGQTASMTCPYGMELKYQSAHYGRGDLDAQLQLASSCPELMLEYNVDALTTMADYCEGLETCQLPVNPLIFGSASVCPKDPKYLMVNYACVPNKLRICESDDITVVCPANSHIKIHSSFYGVKELLYCQTVQVEQTNCYNENPHHATMCEGLTQCKFESRNHASEGDPCPGTWKYMEVEYSCEPN